MLKKTLFTFSHSTIPIIEKALFHDLGNVSVSEYMNTEFENVESESDLSEIQEKVIDNKQKILPVFEKGEFVGVITKTDILDVMMKKDLNRQPKFAAPLKKSVSTKKKNIVNIINQKLPKKIVELLKEIGAVSDELGVGVYVVGGFVRDLLLHRRNEDIDIVIEGNGIDFAVKYAALRNGKIHTYEKFGTAVITLEDGFKIDVASARMEYYKFPAALPTMLRTGTPPASGSG